jgi:hypothetical protein
MPVDLLAAILERTPRQASALATDDHLHRQAGVEVRPIPAASLPTSDLDDREAVSRVRRDHLARTRAGGHELSL